MRYVVLGGNGFIGSHIVDLLLLEGHEVTVLSIHKEKYRDELPGVKYIYGSIEDRNLVKTALKSQEILIHTVSTTTPLTSNNNITRDITSNLLTAVDIFSIAAEYGIKRIIYLSSGGAVYGDPHIIPVPEHHPTNPISSYGITKLAIEKYLALFSQQTGIAYNIIRPSNPYGPRQDPFGKQGVIAVFLGKILTGGKIEVWGDGKIYKDYLYIEDLARAIYASSISPQSSQIFNVGSGTAVSILDIIKAIEKVAHRKIDIQFLPARVFDVHKVCLDITHARTALNFDLTVDLEAGIAKTWYFINQIK